MCQDLHFFWTAAATESFGERTLPSRGKEEEKETARMYRLCELGHLHEQGLRGERGRLVMAREGKEIPECHKQRWTVRVQGQGAAGIGQHFSP